MGEVAVPQVREQKYSLNSVSASSGLLPYNVLVLVLKDLNFRKLLIPGQTGKIDLTRLKAGCYERVTQRVYCTLHRLEAFLKRNHLNRTDRLKTHKTNKRSPIIGGEEGKGCPGKGKSVYKEREAFRKLKKSCFILFFKSIFSVETLTDVLLFPSVTPLHPSYPPHPGPLTNVY